MKKTGIKYFGIMMVVAIMLSVLPMNIYATEGSVTLNPNDKGSEVTLTNGNLTAEIPNLYHGVRAMAGKSTGKWYWEIKVDNGTYVGIGVANNIPSMDMRTFDTPNTRVYYAYYGNKISTYPSPYGAPYGTNDIIGIALDMDNGTVEFFKNGVSQGIAFTDVKSFNTPVFPYVTSCASAHGATVTANFGATSFAYSAPVGFLPYGSGNISEPTNLNITVEDSKANLFWTAVTDATGYNIKRSNTSGGPYTTIASNVSTTTYSDTTATNGITYYYIVTAVDTNGESSNSNEVAATPTAPTSTIIEGNRAIIIITMINDNVKEYDMSALQIEAFLNWYDDKENNVPGTKAYFAIKKNYNIKPFLNSWDYIVFNKIQDFEIKDYNE